MNNKINSTTLEQALQSRILTKGYGGQQDGEGRGDVHGQCRVGHYNSSNRDRYMVIQILLEKGAILSNPKTSHTYCVLNLRSMDIMCLNVEPNYKMNE